MPEDILLSCVKRLVQFKLKKLSKQEISPKSLDFKIIKIIGKLYYILSRKPFLFNLSLRMFFFTLNECDLLSRFSISCWEQEMENALEHILVNMGVKILQVNFFALAWSGNSRKSGNS